MPNSHDQIYLKLFCIFYIIYNYIILYYFVIFYIFIVFLFCFLLFRNICYIGGLYIVRGGVLCGEGDLLGDFIGDLSKS